jgi:hypothetical protein
MGVKDNKFDNLYESAGLVLVKNNNVNSDGVGRKAKPNIRKDLGTIAFLIFLYFQQAITLGLNRSLPLILSARNVTYGAQGTFSFAAWPFSLKILWAPIIDLLYFKKIGRRRSWIIPISLITGVVMICFGNLANNLLYNSKTQTGRQSLSNKITKISQKFYNFYRAYCVNNHICNINFLGLVSRCVCGWMGDISAIERERCVAINL